MFKKKYSFDYIVNQHMNPAKKQAFQILSTCVIAGITGYYFASEKYDPMSLYDPQCDSELRSMKQTLIAANTNQLDDFNINNLRRCQTGPKFKYEYVLKLFPWTVGCDECYLAHWYDSDLKRRCHTVVRSDGKILSREISRGRYDPDNNTVLRAKMVDGYLVGVANEVFFEGKNKYPIYKYEN